MAVFDLLWESWNGGDAAAELSYGSAMAARFRVRVRGEGSEENIGGEREQRLGGLLIPLA